MRFHVTSISAAEVSSLLIDVTGQLRGWLTSAISDSDFGGNLDQVTMVIVSVEDDSERNERWTKSHKGLGRPKNPLTGEAYTNLSFAVAIPPAMFEGADLRNAMKLVTSAFMKTLLERPKRVPKEFDYKRFAKCVTAALSVCGTV